MTFRAAVTVRNAVETYLDFDVFLTAPAAAALALALNTLFTAVPGPVARFSLECFRAAKPAAGPVAPRVLAIFP